MGRYQVVQHMLYLEANTDFHNMEKKDLFSSEMASVGMAMLPIQSDQYQYGSKRCKGLV